MLKDSRDSLERSTARSQGMWGTSEAKGRRQRSDRLKIEEKGDSSKEVGVNAKDF